MESKTIGDQDDLTWSQCHPPCPRIQGQGQRRKGKQQQDDLTWSQCRPPCPHASASAPPRTLPQTPDAASCKTQKWDCSNLLAQPTLRTRTSGIPQTYLLNLESQLFPNLLNLSPS